MSEVRAVHKGITLRLFGERSEAIGFANRMTSIEQHQYHAKAIKGSGGHVVVKAGGKKMYDKAGMLPERLVDEFVNKGAYLEWKAD